MKLLLDAHISRPMMAWLESQGHDCVHISLLEAGMADEAVLRLAYEQQRILLTADKDFGELIFKRALPAVGVVLLRFTVASEAERLALLQRFWPIIERSAPGHFVVVTDRAIRRAPIATE
jgi:predicted nuclease of predicted toxin-antitoxin system